MSTETEKRWFGLRRRSGEERTLRRDDNPRVMLGLPTVGGVPVSERTALQIVDCLACVRLLSETASTLPLVPYRRVADGRERLPGGRLVELLTRPAPAVTQPNLIGQLVASLAMRGNAFVGLYADESGQVAQLGCLPSERVTVEVKGGMPLYTLTHTNGRQTVHTEQDVLHVRMPLSLDGVLGLSPIAQAREALGLAAALSQQASAIIANESVPLGVLQVPPGPAVEDTIENLRAGFEARHGGPANKGRVAVLSGEVKFSAVSLSPVDADFVAQRKLSTQEIARLFRVPPHLIAAEGGSSLTYSNLEMEGAYFLTFALAPYLTAIEAAITNSALCSGPQYVEFLVDGLLRSDSQARALIYTAALDPLTGWMTRAEVRQRENLPPERTPVPVGVA